MKSASFAKFTLHGKECFYANMKTTAFRLGRYLGLIAFSSASLRANVTITSALTRTKSQQTKMFNFETLEKEIPRRYVA